MGYSLQDLLQLMSDLRSPEHGCPWDLKQNFQTIVPHTLEEAYEVADAIERGDLEDLKLELGDLLFQVVFYSQLGKEENAFDFDEVVSGITEKLLRRHPHVFPDGALSSAGLGSGDANEGEIKQNWERIKQQERAEKSVDMAAQSVVDDVPLALPALARAYKLQKRVAQVGFDWQDVEPVFDKLREEIEELQEAIETRNEQRMADELGDLLFTCINISRHLGINPEHALRSSNRKFEQRFRAVENSVRTQNGAIADLSIDELEQEWQRVKREAAD